MKKLETGFLGASYGVKAKNILSERFLIPPFSVLNCREGWWQERKRQWISIGIKSELGRGENLLKMSDTVLEPDPEKRKLLKERRTKGLMKHESSASPFNPGAHGGDPMSMRAKFKQRVDLHQKVDHGDYARNSKGSVYLHRDLGDGTVADMGDSPSGGTSIFDPVLCELIYRWFAPADGRVLDPFSGGSVRGVLASALGLHYTGIDLSERQLKANEEQTEGIEGLTHPPRWIHGDSVDVQRLAKGEYDLVFSCPPYGDLERYSDDPRDLSTLEIAEFRSKYAAIIERATSMLADSGFAAFVVGDYRDKKTGNYTNLPGETINAFERCGMHLYNHIILVVAVGSLPLRVQAGFIGSRKLGNAHQHVLVFAKGNPAQFVRKWKSNIGT